VEGEREGVADGAAGDVHAAAPAARMRRMNDTARTLWYTTTSHLTFSETRQIEESVGSQYTKKGVV
jgi:hypothetical protein